MSSEAKYIDIDPENLNTNACEIYIDLYLLTYQTSKDMVEFAFSHSQKIAMSINSQLKNGITEQLIKDYLYHLNVMTETMLCASTCPFQQFKDVFKIAAALDEVLRLKNMPFRLQVLDFTKTDVGNHKFFILREV